MSISAMQRNRVRCSELRIIYKRRQPQNERRCEKTSYLALIRGKRQFPISRKWSLFGFQTGQPAALTSSCPPHSTSTIYNIWKSHGRFERREASNEMGQKSVQNETLGLCNYRCEHVHCACTFPDRPSLVHTTSNASRDKTHRSPHRFFVLAERR